MFWMMLFACKEVVPAPKDIDSLSRYFWQHFADEDGSALQEGIKSLHTAINAEQFSDVIDGSLSTLSKEDLSLVDQEDNDPSLLSGVFFVNKIQCPLLTIEEKVSALNQDELHPDFFDSYHRRYTLDYDRYINREEEILTWETDYELTALGIGYEANVLGWLRYVPKESDLDHADMLITRAVMTEPAYFDEDEEMGFFQDYQLEVFYQLNSQESMHFYMMWREMYYAIGALELDFANESYQRIVLNKLPDWDVDMEEGCK